LTEHGKQLLKNFLDIKITPPPSTEPSMLKPFIAKTINRTDLTAEEAEEAQFRLQRVTQWHARAAQFLPMAEMILQSASKLMPQSDSK